MPRAGRTSLSVARPSLLAYESRPGARAHAMIREFLHSLPAVPLALVLLAGILAPVGVVVWLLGLDVPRSDRSDDNVLTSAIRFVGGAFALLSAFIIVSLSTQASSARSALRAEAAAADSFAREAKRLPGPAGAALVREVEAYLVEVVDHEWPLMNQPNRTHDPADDEMDHLFDTLFSAAPPAGQYDARYALVAGSLDEFEETRVQRLLTARDPLSTVLWTALLVSAAMMLSVAALYPPGGHRAAKWVQLLSISAVIATVLFVVLALEHPYDGFLAIEPTALRAVLKELRR